MKVAIYTRVSTDEQASEGYSLQVQEDYLTDYAKKWGWNIYHPQGARSIYSDDMSGYKLERPAFQQMLKDARKKKFDLILVYKLDRLSRRLRDLENIRTELELYGVHMKSATEPFDTSDSSGALMFQLLGSFAEFERNRIKERVFPGMIKGVEQGNWQGSRFAPYGYRYDKQSKELEVIPEEANVVKLIFQMYLANQSTSRITKHFYEKGYKTRCGGRFHSKLVRDILRNRIYIGEIEWNKNHYDPTQTTRKGLKYIKNEKSKIVIGKGRHKPLVSKEDWNTVQDKLDKNRKGCLHRTTNRAYPLTGILFCAECGHKFRGASNVASHKTKVKKRYYRCDAKHQHGIECNAKAIIADVLEAQIDPILEVLVAHSDVDQKRVNKLVRQNIEIKDEDLKQEKETLESRLKENIKSQSKLCDAYLAKLFPLDVYKDKCIDLRVVEQKLKKEIREVNIKIFEKDRAEALTKILDRVANGFVRKTKKELDIIEQKELLQLVFKRIVLKDKKIQKVEFHEPFKTYFEEQKCNLNQVIAKTCQSSSILSPTAAK